MLYGASYYHEYQPYPRLAEDIRLMREANLTVVRLGESTWASWEPEDGRFETDWMDTILDALHAAGIKVIFGTPTYAIPPWMHRKHPEIMAQYARGERAWYGARQNMDLAHPTFLYYTERIIRQLIGHFAAHPAIIGYQVDNETSSGSLHNPDVFQRFLAYVKARYGTVERVNEVWGLTYWSHRLSDWADLWTPDGNTNPGYALEWRRFQSQLVTDFLAWQVQIVRGYARPDQFITQDFVGGHGRPESDVYQASKTLDIVAINPYHPTQDGLLLPRPETASNNPWWLDHPQSDVARGVWYLYECGQLGWSARRSNFLVTELNALSIGESYANFPSYDGQWRLATYAYISQGANMVAYWHWHTLHYGNEAYWGGILNHDLEPGRCYAEISRIGHELAEHGDLLTDLSIESDVALLYSQDSKYALDFQPCLSLPNSNKPNPQSYQTIFDTFYCALFDARAQTAVVHPEQAFESYRLLVVPALYIADDTLLERLIDYARSGGHLLLTFRSGYADEYGRMRPVRAPGKLREAVGASYQEYSNLIGPLRLSATDAGLTGLTGLTVEPEAAAQGWADGLLLEGAAPLAYYAHPHFGKFPVIVSQPFGQGRVTYCGTLPNRALGKALADWVMQQAQVAPVGGGLPESVRLNVARARDGRRLAFYTNWSWEPQSIPVTGLPFAGHELFSGAPAASLNLDAWDVQIAVEDPA